MKGERARAARVWEDHGEAITTVACAAFVVAGWLLARRGVPTWTSAAVFLVAYVIGGYRQAIEGVTTLVRERELDVDLLMVVAAVGAAAIGFWFDGALLIVIFALSGTLEGYASARTKKDIEALMALHPDEAVVVRNGAEVVIAPSWLKRSEEASLLPTRPTTRRWPARAPTRTWAERAGASASRRSSTECRRTSSTRVRSSRRTGRPWC